MGKLGLRKGGSLSQDTVEPGFNLSHMGAALYSYPPTASLEGCYSRPQMSLDGHTESLGGWALALFELKQMFYKHICFSALGGVNFPL